MDSKEKINRRAKDAIVAWLVSSEQPKNAEEALVLIDEFEATPYDKLLSVRAYTLARRPYTNAAQRWYMDVCIDAAERSKAKPEEIKA